MNCTVCNKGKLERVSESAKDNTITCLLRCNKCETRSSNTYTLNEMDERDETIEEIVKGKDFSIEIDNERVLLTDDDTYDRFEFIRSHRVVTAEIISVIEIPLSSPHDTQVKSFSNSEDAEDFFIAVIREDDTYREEDKESYLDDGIFESNTSGKTVLLIHNTLRRS